MPNRRIQIREYPNPELGLSQWKFVVSSLDAPCTIPQLCTHRKCAFHGVSRKSK